MEQKDRQFYERLFANQPDVLDAKTVGQLLGGISSCTVRRLCHGGKLKHIYYQEKYYLIPKIWLIDHILSNYGQNRRSRLHSQINNDTYEKDGIIRHSPKIYKHLEV